MLRLELSSPADSIATCRVWAHSILCCCSILYSERIQINAALMSLLAIVAPGYLAPSHVAHCLARQTHIAESIVPTRFFHDSIKVRHVFFPLSALRHGSTKTRRLRWCRGISEIENARSVYREGRHYTIRVGTRLRFSLCGLDEFAVCNGVHSPEGFQIPPRIA
jgi:hypothetical protein